MGIERTIVWRCDECGHRWLQTPGVTPQRCPHRDCRSIKWNATAPTTPQSDSTTMVTTPVQAPNYQRVAHDQRCTCHTCRPPARA